MDTLKLYGVPGSGKTTRGLDWLEERMADGCDPWRTAFVSFTNAAVDEATMRIMGRFNLEKQDLPYCRTIHSLAKRALTMETEDWIADKHIGEFGQQYGFDMGKTPKKVDDDEDWEAPSSSSGRDANLLAIWDFARHRLIEDGDDAWDAFYEYAQEGTRGLTRDRFLGFVEDYERWKLTSGLMDFTDLLIRYLREGEPLPLDLAVVDECQDLSGLLWKCADKLFANATYRALIGDCDQAIALFMGADPQHVMNRHAEEIIKLEHSWRCPQAVTELAKEIIFQNSNREELAIRPRHGEEGVAENIRHIDEADLTNGESWGIMARNWRLLEPVAQQLEAQGVPYLYGGWRYSPWSERGPLRAVKAVRRLRANGWCTHEEIQAIASKSNMGTAAKDGVWVKGSKKRIKELAEENPNGRVQFVDLADLGMTEWGATRLIKDPLGLLTMGVSERDLTAYDVALQNGTMDARPVTLTSIHGWKGREFDNAIGVLSCGLNTAKAMSRPDGQEEERRVAYVAVTRARKRFYSLMMPPASGAYPWNIYQCRGGC